MPLICAEELCFGYDSATVLEAVSFKVERSEVLLLLGPNGCGKTTLLDCLVGYKRITGGRILLEGRSLESFSLKERAQKIAYVPQKSQDIFPYSALQMVLMGRTPYIKDAASPSKRDNEIACEALESLGMGGFRERIFTGLSGGEQQLVLIARALAQDTDLILLDESTAFLDIKNESAVLEKICDLAKRTNKAFIMATHQPNHAFYIEDKGINVTAALFEHHTLGFCGPPSCVLNEGVINRVYAVKSKIIDCGEGRKTIILD